MEDLFDECCNNEKYREPVNKISNIDKLIVDAEAEFTGTKTSHIDREKEKKELEDTVKSLEIQLSKLKNPSNTAKLPFNKREHITKKLNDEREKIRKHIKQCKVRLDEIELETPKKEESKEIKPSSDNSKWGSNPYDGLI